MIIKYNDNTSIVFLSNPTIWVDEDHSLCGAFVFDRSTGRMHCDPGLVGALCSLFREGAASRFANAATISASGEVLYLDLDYLIHMLEGNK